MDPVTIVGGLAAAMQLVTTAARALKTTIKLIKDLKEIPVKLTVLLIEVDDSISRLCESCNTASILFRSLNSSQLDKFSKCIQALYPTLHDIRAMLVSILEGINHGKGAPIRRLWSSIMSRKLETELADKLIKLNRLNLEVIRDMTLLGVEMQTTTQDLLTESKEASGRSFSALGTKMDTLRSEFQAYTLSVQQTHAITLDGPKKADDDLKYGSPTRSESASLASSTSSPDLTLATPELSEAISGSIERVEEMRRYLATDSTVGSSPLSIVSTRPQNAGLEFILFNIRTFYTAGNFDSFNVKTRGRFWKDTKLAIYLVKSANSNELGSGKSENRGLKLLKESSTEASSDLTNGTASILIELLSTLSPTNTALCLYIREALLQYLYRKVRHQLAPEHPIALVVKGLMTDNRDENVSIRALELLSQRLCTILGPTHELTELATRRLCALLRRSGDYSKALAVGNEGVRAIRKHVGYNGSLSERMLLRQVEQVHMAEKEWLAALSICFHIVGQGNTRPGSDPDPEFHDECAVYTMEDIAKICECSDNLVQAIAWLKQARISGGMVWGQTQALGHVQDKLMELLAKAGKEDELALWSSVFGGEPEPHHKSDRD